MQLWSNSARLALVKPSVTIIVNGRVVYQPFNLRME